MWSINEFVQLHYNNLCSVWNVNILTNLMFQDEGWWASVMCDVAWLDPCVVIIPGPLAYAPYPLIRNKN